MVEIREAKTVIGVDPGERQLISWALVNKGGDAVRIRQYPPPITLSTYSQVIRGQGDINPEDEPALYEAMSREARNQYRAISQEIVKCASLWDSLIVVNFDPPLPSNWWSLAEVFQTMAPIGGRSDAQDLARRKHDGSQSVLPFLPLKFFVDDLTLGARRARLPDPQTIGAPSASTTCAVCRTQDRTVCEGADFRCEYCGYNSDAGANAAHSLGLLGWQLLLNRRGQYYSNSR